MDRIRSRIKELSTRYKYVPVVVFAGILLMLLPQRESTAFVEVQPSGETADMAQRLEQVLELIQGVGRVRVLLTEAQGSRTLYVYDEDTSRSGESESSRQEAVVITDANRVQSGMVSQIIPPVYQGAVVVCQGGDLASVRLAVVEAVCDATGLSADKITVLKMK